MPRPYDMNLTSKQRAHLRKLAHHLKPVVLVGTDGVTPAVLDSILDAFNTRELLKVKLQESAPLNVREAADEISSRLDDVHAVQTIGRTAVLYRPDPEDPEIELPGGRG
ncbi:MAG: YhbY family RNA-binding protein [Longimicrobiales bacterium]|nr:YhbY family RNA-binding protein [Longimicrobiales bacterium]